MYFISSVYYELELCKSTFILMVCAHFDQLSLVLIRID